MFIKIVLRVSDVTKHDSVLRIMPNHCCSSHNDPESDSKPAPMPAPDPPPGFPDLSPDSDLPPNPGPMLRAGKKIRVKGYYQAKHP